MAAGMADRLWASDLVALWEAEKREGRKGCVMRVLEVHLNKKRLCVAGIGEDGVLNAMILHVMKNGKGETTLQIGGSISPVNENVTWNELLLKTGDTVQVRVRESLQVDNPVTRHRGDPTKEKAYQRRYVREMAKQLGWKVIPISK